MAKPLLIALILYNIFSFIDAFVDWVSILNQYCQKNRINQPKYSEASNPCGGFGSSVVVTTERFFSNAYCSTKKEAKHCAARAALLGLNIAVCK
jgi:dsRNA-specific ribonuclease